MDDRLAHNDHNGFNDDQIRSRRVSRLDHDE